MNKEIKIITLGDIFDNIETEEKAFKFKDYIKDLQQKVEQLQKENRELKQPQVFIDCEDMEERYGRDLYEDYLKEKIEQLEKENKRLNNIISEIERLIINHNCDTGDIYYKYNSKYLKSELKERIMELVELKENK